MNTQDKVGAARHRMLAAIGPGLLVMLADNDAGSVITAAQSGARWGYRLLLLQFLLLPVLVAVQELAARLGLLTGRGFAELVRLRFGRPLSMLAVATLLVSCFGALVTQMSGLAGIGQLYGVPVWLSIAITVAFVLAMVLTGSYRSVELVAIALGLFGLAFLLVAWRSHPDPAAMLRQLAEMPLGNRDYLYLVAANLGTCIMPWAVFYQQSALIDKALPHQALRWVRLDIVVGACVCQLITAAVLVAAAAALGGHVGGVGLESVPQLATAFTSVLGETMGRSVFALALSGCALVAAIVVCLSAAWAVGEAVGVRHSLEHHPREAPLFYLGFAALLVIAGGLVASGVNLVRLSIATGVVNAILLPVVLALLYVLAVRELRAAQGLGTGYRRTLVVLFIATGALALYAGIAGALG
jgi:Mn2+/Fe2+ NRAMP family transporter